MIRLTDVRLPLDHPQEALATAAAARLGRPVSALRSVTVARRSWDARRRGDVVLVYTLDVESPGAPGPPPPIPHDTRPPPAPHPLRHRPVVVGAGPCGLLATLALARAGYRPILLERGQPVRTRARDTWGLWRQGVLMPESNVQFGEGGAGLFSDGKLYSQARDPADRAPQVLRALIEAGAGADLLTAARPHIGTFRLVKIVENLRATILALGGEVRFGARVEGLVLGVGRRVEGVVLAGGATLAARQVVLAVGHSARDVFGWLAAAAVALRAKPFSIGVRIEHPQSLIDRARFGAQAGHPALGAADYKLVHHAANGRSVYSFCMCPGGTVVAAASEAGGVVTNGMSQHSRAERNANAGLVVGITPEVDYPHGPLAGIEYQRQWERAAFAEGGGRYAAPAQRVGDFLAGRRSASLGSVVPSYRPGVRPADLRACLPGFATAALAEALPVFSHRLPGYALDDAVMTAVETRTSSPVRIERDPASGQSLNTPGLFPAGEGAGFAGGILSAAIDGLGVADAVARAICA